MSLQQGMSQFDRILKDRILKCQILKDWMTFLVQISNSGEWSRFMNNSEKTSGDYNRDKEKNYYISTNF